MILPKANDISPIARPRNFNMHSLISTNFLKQHFMIDSRWGADDIKSNYKLIAELTAKRNEHYKRELYCRRRGLKTKYHTLQKECREGREKLKTIKENDNLKILRNILIDHKELWRLYQRMSLSQVDENLDQRTFVLRKERDSHKCRLKELKDTFHNMLINKATIENRIKYHDEFVLPEEGRAGEFRKKIEASNIRLRGYIQVHKTYQKMIEVLRHDGIFYDHILSSLEQDANDQEKFITYIINLTQPAISRLGELHETYKKEERIIVALMQDRNSKRSYTTAKDLEHRYIATAPGPSINSALVARRFTRETGSMIILKRQQKRIENEIKNIQLATLCTDAADIYPSMKSLRLQSLLLQKNIVKSDQKRGHMDKLNGIASLVKNILYHNLTKEEQHRLKRIELLKNAIKKEDDKTANTLAYLKNRGSAIVLLRSSFWTIEEILRHIGKARIGKKASYRTDYLTWPLLTFEALPKRVFPPDWLEEDLGKSLKTIKTKLSKVINALKSTKINPTMIDKHHYMFVYRHESEDQRSAKMATSSESDVVVDLKTYHNIPTRKQIHNLSAKLVEENSKLED